MKRENQVFEGRLKDKELYLIENALQICKEEGYEGFGQADKLIQKLYSEFWKEAQNDMP